MLFARPLPTLLTPALFGAALALSATPALADTVASNGSGPETVLSLSASADTALPADLLTIHMRAEATGTDAVSVQQTVNQTVSKTLAKIKTVSGITASTGSYNVWERNDPAAANRKSWQASQTIALSAHRFDTLLDLVGRLQQDGLLVSGMEYSLSDEARRSVHDRLVADAIARLKADTAVAAKSLGMRVSYIKTIRIDPESGGRPIMLKSMAAAAPVAPSGEPAEQRVQLSVEAEVALSPAP